MFLFMKSEINYVEFVADGLKKHCEKWGYKDRLKELKKDSSIKNFRKLFFKITHLYYVFFEGDCYNVTFSKKEDVGYVKRCGKDFDERSEDAIIDIKELIEALVR